jgi:hypothetical protein
MKKNKNLVCLRLSLFIHPSALIPHPLTNRCQAEA